MPAVLAMSMPELSLIFFMGMFLLLVLRLVFARPGRWDKEARIPLGESANGDASAERTSAGGSNDVR